MPLHWVQVEREFVEGPEPDNIGAELGIDAEVVIGKAVRMWTWSLDHAAPDGIVYGAGASATIERAANWKGKRGRWVAEMVRVGILDEVDGGLRFRGWTERYGKALTETEKSRLRKRKQRSKERQNVTPVTPDVTRDIPRDTQRDNPRDLFSRDRTTDRRLETGEETPEPKPEPPQPESTAVVVEGEDTDELPPTRAGCWEFIQRERIARGLPREDRPPRGFDEWHDAAVVRVGPGGVSRALERYLSDPDFRAKGWPTAVFITPGVFNHRAQEAG